MNTLTSCNILSPSAIDEECGQFTIDEVMSPFVLHDITSVGEKYTLSFWARSDSEGSMVVCGSTIQTNTEWVRFVKTYKANIVDLYFWFNTTDSYYIYHPQLELGSRDTDWKEAPEDVDDRIDALDNDLRKVITEQNTSLTQTIESIILEASKTYISSSDYESFKKTVEASLEALPDKIGIQISESIAHLDDKNKELQGQLTEITKHFVFDINGLTIGQKDSRYKVVLDNDDFTMYVDDDPVLILKDGRVKAPEVEVTKGFKLFGYLIDEDPDGNVNCAYAGGGN